MRCAPSRRGEKRRINTPDDTSETTNKIAGLDGADEGVVDEADGGPEAPARDDEGHELGAAAREH